MTKHYLGIDVGTGSARAGVFDQSGTLLGSAKHDIAVWHEAGDIVEQSSNDIWRAVCASVREAVAKSAVAAGSIAGIGFDATCSLVVIGQDGQPLPVSNSANDERNIIVWMDHRATEQARRINRTGHDVLNYVGGSISPEMETAEAALAGRAHARHVWQSLAVFRSDGFPDLANNRQSCPQATFVENVWGPYFSAMVPGLWLNEGGQSAAGAAIDHLVRLHPAAEQAARTAQEHGVSLSHWLSLKVEERGGAATAEKLVGGVHVVPEFLGNRAPFADPDARGLIAGLGMETDLDSLISLYLAGVYGLGYGVRQIVRSLHEKNVPIDTIVISGGAGQSPLVRQLLADATGIVVAASTSQEPVLLGSAMLGAVAAGHYKDAVAAMAAMSELGELYRPSAASVDWQARRFAAFELLQRAGQAVRTLAET